MRSILFRVLSVGAIELIIIRVVDGAQIGKR